LKVGYDFSYFSLTSSTGYIDYKNYSALTFEPIGVNTLQFTKLDRTTFSEELVFNSRSEGPWRWTVGGMYRDSDDRHRIDFDPTRFRFPTSLAQDQEDLSESVAVFGELTRSLFDDKLELTAGLRYFRDDYTFEENVSYTGNPATPLVRTSATFDATTPRVVLTWLPTEQLTMYASYSEGFRSGLTQLPLALATASALGVSTLPPLEPDSLKNYEIGSKGNLWGGVLGFDVAVYYIDWQDTQRSLNIPLFGNNVAPFVGALVNANSVSGTGVDFEFTLRPMRGLLLGANISHNDLRYDSDVVSGGLVIIPQGSTLGTPRTTYGAFADYAFPIGSFTARLAGSLDYISEGCQWGFTAARVPRKTCGTDIKGTRASVSLESGSRWSATLFGENLLNRNDRYSVVAGLPDWDNRLRPRTIGLQVEYNY
jgi:iron complex outermembrane receptor protein